MQRLDRSGRGVDHHLVELVSQHVGRFRQQDQRAARLGEFAERELRSEFVEVGEEILVELVPGFGQGVVKDDPVGASGERDAVAWSAG